MNYSGLTESGFYITAASPSSSRFILSHTHFYVKPRPLKFTPTYNIFNSLSSNVKFQTPTTMSSSGAQVYVTDDFSEPMTAQHNFVNNFDLEKPEDAMSAYQRYVSPNSLQLNHV